jgi:hypothetical protein
MFSIHIQNSQTLPLKIRIVVRKKLTIPPIWKTKANRIAEGIPTT